MPTFKIFDLRRFLLGCLISVFSFLLIFLIEYSREEYILNGSVTFSSILRASMYCLSIAVLEEFFFRYLFLRKWINDKARPFDKRVVYLGLVSSLLFGFLHLNLDVYPIMQINIALSGMSLFLGTYLFKSVSIAVGMHFSWNFIEGVIFPFEGSGSNLGSILMIKNSTVSIFPEASNFMFLTFLFEITAIWVLSKNYGPIDGTRSNARNKQN